MKPLQANAAAALLMAVMLLGTPASSWAQETNDSRTYGTGGAFHTISAWAFTGLAATDNAVVNATAESNRYCTALCTFVAPVMLPAGSRLNQFQLAACNQNPGIVITARVLRKRQISGEPVQLASVNFGTQATSGGCNGMSVHFPADTVIDNALNTYLVLVTVRGGDIRTQFDSVLLTYSLQVSPAPAVATFTDVPTNHPFFQFIEALADAGITGGCHDPGTPPRYCPGDPVTRGQMAVFISRALGLHFAP